MLLHAFHRFLSISLEFQKNRAWLFENLARPGTAVKARPATLIETFARFQAGFLSSEDVHSNLKNFIDFHGFRVWLFENLSRPGTTVKTRPATPIETSAWFQAGHLSFEGVHCNSCIFIDCYGMYMFFRNVFWCLLILYIYFAFHRFSWIWGMAVWKPVTTWHQGSNSTCCPFGAFARLQAGFLSSENFHRISQNCMDFLRFPWIAGWLAARLASKLAGSLSC